MSEFTCEQHEQFRRDSILSGDANKHPLVDCLTDSDESARRWIAILKRCFAELDAEHERLKLEHQGWRGVEPEPLQRVRLMKEKIAKEIWNEKNL